MRYVNPLAQLTLVRPLRIKDLEYINSVLALQGFPPFYYGLDKGKPLFNKMYRPGMNPPRIGWSWRRGPYVSYFFLYFDLQKDSPFYETAAKVMGTSEPRLFKQFEFDLNLVD